MTRKPVARRKATGGDTFITAGRDVIQGDQINVRYQQITHIATPAEFIARLQELQAQIAALKQQPGLPPAPIAAAEEHVRQALQEARKPRPLVERITTTLANAQAVMDGLGAGVQSAVALGLILGELGKIALRLFG